jgi:hypothetical protein
MSAYYDNNKIKLQSKTKKIKKTTKEQFYPNIYPKDLMYSMMNEFGSLIRNKQYSKSESNAIRKAVKRGQLAGFLPFCPRHYFDIQ